MCDFALQAAPNVLYGRYKQYGQVRICDHLSLVCSLIPSSPPSIPNILAGRARLVLRVQ